MSVITTWEAVPNRIEAVVRYLSERTSVSTSELYDVLSPPSLREARTVVSRVVEEASSLGLVRRDDEDRWSLATGFEAGADVRKHIRYTLLTPELAERAKQPWVAPAIAWFLTRDVSEPLVVSENWHTRVERDCPDAGNAFELVNMASCQQFAYWVVYLGFGWRLATGTREARADEVLVPDPSAALKSALHATLKLGETLPVAEAISRVSTVCSVIEGGHVRESVENQLVAERRRPAGQLSRSTSFALTRLAEQGVIELPPPPSDARVMTLDLWPQPQRVSHIRLCEDQS